MGEVSPTTSFPLSSAYAADTHYGAGGAKRRRKGSPLRPLDSLLYDLIYEEAHVLASQVATMRPEVLPLVDPP